MADYESRPLLSDAYKQHAVQHHESEPELMRFSKEIGRSNCVVEIANCRSHGNLSDPTVCIDAGHVRVPPDPTVPCGSKGVCAFTKKAYLLGGTTGLLSYAYDIINKEQKRFAVFWRVSRRERRFGVCWTTINRDGGTCQTHWKEMLERFLNKSFELDWDTADALLNPDKFLLQIKSSTDDVVYTVKVAIVLNDQRAILKVEFNQEYKLRCSVASVIGDICFVINNSIDAQNVVDVQICQNGLITKCIYTSVNTGTQPNQYQSYLLK